MFILALLLQLAAVWAITPITTKGNMFFQGNNRFFFRGVDYQPGGFSVASNADPLSDKATCERDVANFKDLGVNSIRVYQVNPALNHDDCMKLLEEAGIYLVLDINTPDTSINRGDPTCSYNSFYLKNVFQTIDAFAKYDNVMGFFAANEMILDLTNTKGAKYVRAVIRDMKQYMKKQNYRAIPVGYSAADIANVETQFQYFTCGNAESKIDFWGHNKYSWCGYSTYEKSGYNTFTTKFQDTTVPFMFSEYGCNAGGGRPFTEMESIYSTNMSSFLSGGLVYEYSQEDNNYGLVKISDGKVTKLTDYTNVKSMLAKVKNPSGLAGGKESVTKTVSCPATGSSWASDMDLPDTPAAAKEMIEKGSGKVVSLSELGNTQQLCNAEYKYAMGSGSSSTTSTSASSTSHSSTSSTSTTHSSTSSTSTSHSSTSTTHSSTSSTSTSHSTTTTTSHSNTTTSHSSSTTTGHSVSNRTTHHRTTHHITAHNTTSHGAKTVSLKLNATKTAFYSNGTTHTTATSTSITKSAAPFSTHSAANITIMTGATTVMFVPVQSTSLVTADVTTTVVFNKCACEHQNSTVAGSRWNSSSVLPMFQNQTGLTNYTSVVYTYATTSSQVVYGTLSKTTISQSTLDAYGVTVSGDSTSVASAGSSSADTTATGAAADSTGSAGSADSASTSASTSGKKKHSSTAAASASVSQFTGQGSILAPSIFTLLIGLLSFV